MITTTRTPDDEVEGRAATAPATTTGPISYAMPRTPGRPLPRLAVPAAVVGLGVVLGGGALAVLQSF